MAVEEREFQEGCEAKLTVVYAVPTYGGGFGADPENIVQNGRWIDDCRHQI